MISNTPFQILLRMLPKGEALTRLLRVGAVTLVGTGCLLFVMLVIVPDMREMDEKVAALTAARRDLVIAEEEREQKLEQLQIMSAKVSDELAEKQGIFMSKAQAAAAVDRLYLYASQIEIEINDLKNLPSPKPSGNLDYEVEAFRVIAQGSLPRLMIFIGQIEETMAYEGYLLTNIRVAEADNAARHVLTMDVTMYTHKDATGEPLIGMAAMELKPTPPTTDTGDPQDADEGESTTHEYLVRPADWPDDWEWPPAGQGDADGEEALYTVVEGDTLSTIAEQFNTTLGTLMDMNQLADTHLEPGQQLRVPR